MVENRSLAAALRETAHQRPDAKAFTYLDYEFDPAGRAETTTWSQIHNRVQVVAAELATTGAPGDRVAVLAPHGLEYIVGVLGAMTAGLIAVPLSVPMLGVHGERVTAALQDSEPVAVVATTTVVDDVVSCLQALSGPTPAVIELDALDLDGPADPVPIPQTKTALLQYTSGSTRAPKGVVVTHNNVVTNLNQALADYFDNVEAVTPPELTMVSWLPFYHDMGLLVGVAGPVLRGFPAVLTSPMAFLQKPARWIQLLASHRSFSAAPNFAFELAAARTCDDDMAGLDLSSVDTVLSGAERIHAATLRRFTERFVGFGLSPTAVAPSYGLAEAMVYVTSAPRANRPTTARFDYNRLSSGYAVPCQSDEAVELVSVGPPRACTLRIVDPETRVENPAGQVGEIWLYGDNVAASYWHKPDESAHTFGGRIVDPSPETPSGPWLRTGDLGVDAGDGFYIVGRIKDLLVVDGRNHYPDDIEATIQEISGGRVAAVTVADNGTERLVTVVELKTRGSSDDEVLRRLDAVKRDVTSKVSSVHGVRISDVVLVARGSIPITTSGKIRRASCAEQYRHHGFSRLNLNR